MHRVRLLGWALVREVPRLLLVRDARRGDRRAGGPGKGDALGDIILGFETIAREAEEQKKPLLHHAQHLTMHGILHLLGFDHECEEEAAKMEALETKLCLSLGIADPYKDADTGN